MSLNFNSLSYEKIALTACLSVGGIASGAAIASVSSVAAKIALGIAAAFFSAASIGSITAGISSRSRREYYEAIVQHTSLASVGVLQTIMYTVVQVLFKAGSDELYARLRGRERPGAVRLNL